MAVFDFEAEKYDCWYKSKLGSFVDMVETKLAFDLFKAKKGQKVLDVGCGTGNFSIKLAKKGCVVTGIDISEKMLDIAKAKAASSGLDIDFMKMDVYNLQFPDEHFDAVFSMAAFEFIEFPEKAMDELFRVTKKNGDILIGTINGDSKWGEMYSSKEYKENSVFKYAFFKTPEDLRKIRKKQLVDLRQCLFIPPDINEEKLSLEVERELSKVERGGFFCALWKK